MGKKRGHRKWNNFSHRGGRQPVLVPQRQLVPVGHAFKPVPTKKKHIIDYPVDWLRKIKPTLYPSRQAQLSTEQTVQGVLQLGQFILENAQLTHPMFEQVLQATRNTTRPLTKLSIVKTILDNADGHLLIQALAGQQQLQFIALANNKLFTPEVFLSFIDNILTKQNNLEELYLIQEVGSLGNEVLKRLGGFLVHHPTLKKLGIIDKNLDGNGLNELLTGLKSNSVLEVLNLSECSGLNDGLQQLGALLKQKNCKIRELYLNNTEASNNTIKAIAEALQVNQVLEKLALRYNNFDDHAAETLCWALFDNTQLRDLDLRYNHLSVKTSEQFIEHMQSVLDGDLRYLAGDRTATILRRMPRILLFNPNSPAPTRNTGTDELDTIAKISDGLKTAV